MDQAEGGLIVLHPDMGPDDLWCDRCGAGPCHEDDRRSHRFHLCLNCLDDIGGWPASMDGVDGVSRCPECEQAHEGKDAHCPECEQHNKEGR